MASKNPFVSVVMPVYNSERYIAEAIESILNQTYKNFEFIIIEDGSTDRSVEIIKRYAKKDKRIRLIRNKENLRICKTLNKGIKLSKGEYIARMDSDDISYPLRLEKQVKFMEENKEVSVLGGWIKIIDIINGEEYVRRYSGKDSQLKKDIFFFSPFAHPVVMIRKDSLRVLKYDSDYPNSQDLDLWFKLGERGKFSNIQEVLLDYRIHEKSATGSKQRRMELYANKIRWENCKNPHYHFGFKALIYNVLHRISIYLVPCKIKLWLFERLRR